MLGAQEKLGEMWDLLDDKGNITSESDSESQQPRDEPQKPTRSGGPVTGPPRIEALDATRWIASTLIMGSHFMRFIVLIAGLPASLNDKAVWGDDWTQYFFMLSGFVLSYVEMTRPPDQQFALSTREYVKKRLINIYPTYIFAVVIACFSHTRDSPRDLFDWLTLPLHILLLQAWVPLTYPAGNPPFEEPYRWEIGATRWCPTSWFISALLLYWIILPPCARRIHRLTMPGCVGLLLSCWGCSLLFLCSGRMRDACGPGSLCDQLVFTTLQFTWLGYVHVFLFGIAASRFFILLTAEMPVAEKQKTPRLVFDTSRAPLLLRYGCSGGYTLFAACVAFAPTFTNEENYGGFMVMHNGGMLPIMLLIILGAALGWDPLARHVFATPVFVVLGRISYAQYLLHLNIARMVASTVGYNKTLFVVLPVAVVAGSYLTDRYVTQPYSEWLRAKPVEQKA